MGDSSWKKVCGGYFSLELQRNKELQVTFNAPSGYELEMGALDEGINFEFQAKNTNINVNCDSIGDLGDAPYDIEPRMVFDTTSALQSIRSEKRFSTPRIVGSGIDKLSLDKTRSFARVTTCEIHFKMQFQGLSTGETVRLTEMSFTVPYNSDSMLKGPQEFHYQSSGPMGIKASKPTLVEVTGKGESMKSQSSVTKPVEGPVMTTRDEENKVVESEPVQEVAESALRGAEINSQSTLAASSSSAIRPLAASFAVGMMAGLFM